MIALFTGTRHDTVKGAEAVRAKLDFLRARHAGELSVLVGDCPSGIDAHVRLYCGELGIDFATFNANWSYSKKRAGPNRNTFLVQTAANLNLAGPVVRVFYYAPRNARCIGTRDCVRKASRSGLTCYPLGDSVDLVERKTQ